jgi:monomeric sarcosine oxidase
VAAYDAIVLGTGGVGSAALWLLAQRGAKVLGLDRFAPPHDRGSSHGQSRIFRQAYFEHSNYTPLLLEAYRLWSELAERCGRQLYHEVGVLQMGPPDGEVVPGVLRSAAEHGLEVEQLSADEIQRRWPAYRVAANLVGVFEPRAGYLSVEACVAAHLEQAQRAGAELRTGVEVLGWEPGPPVRVRTRAGEFSAERLIVTAGAWAAQLLGELALHLEVRRKSMFWFATDPRQPAAHADVPCFLYELPHGVFYGFPRIDERGVKVAEHSGGQKVVDPLEVERGVDREDGQRIEAFVADYLPCITSRRTDHAVCLYTMSSDEHFLVDRHPAHPQVVFAAGLSGHGFKFAPILGQALTELALDGTTKLPIRFLALR